VAIGDWAVRREALQQRKFASNGIERLGNAGDWLVVTLAFCYAVRRV